MSFTDPQLQARIQGLKNQFEEIDHEVEASTTSDQNDFPLRLAVISNLFKTMESSLDQISVCFQVSKAMFFYQDLIIQNPEFWEEEQGVNQMLASNNFKMAQADMDESGLRLNAEAAFLKVQQRADQTSVNKFLGLVADWEGLVGRFAESVSLLTKADERKEQNLPRYNEGEQPDLEGDSPEAHLKGLHLKSSQNAAAALVKNADLAESLFASIHFRKAHGAPLEDIKSTETALALILDRFEALEDVRDNRHGFTQIRFG